MKTHKIASVFSALFIVILCVSLFTACQRVERIEANQVERIVIWTQQNTKGYELNADDSAKFIELYNASKYEGKATGEGFTPDYGILVYFRDGTYLSATNWGFEVRHFEVALHDLDGNHKAWYFITSKELYTFVLELVDKFTEPSS